MAKPVPALTASAPTVDAAKIVKRSEEDDGEKHILILLI